MEKVEFVSVYKNFSHILESCHDHAAFEDEFNEEALINCPTEEFIYVDKFIKKVLKRYPALIINIGDKGVNKTRPTDLLEENKNLKKLFLKVLKDEHDFQEAINIFLKKSYFSEDQDPLIQELEGYQSFKITVSALPKLLKKDILSHLSDYVYTKKAIDYLRDTLAEELQLCINNNPMTNNPEYHKIKSDIIALEKEYLIDDLKMYVNKNKAEEFWDKF